MRTLLHLRHHCWELSRLLRDIDSVRWSHASDWLRIASGIVAVKVDATSLDPSFGWCSGADEYTLAQDDIAEALVRDIARFMFVWGTLEAVVDGLHRHLPAGRGKLNRAAVFLEERYRNQQLIDPYDAELLKLCGLIQEPPGDPKYIAHLSTGSVSSGASIGVRVVYRMRNTFAHGAMPIPNPDPQDHQPQFHESEIIECATRVVLLSIQMLVAAAYNADNRLFEPCGDDFCVDDETVSLREAIRRIHYRLEDCDDHEQARFDFR